MTVYKIGIYCKLTNNAYYYCNYFSLQSEHDWVYPMKTHIPRLCKCTSSYAWPSLYFVTIRTWQWPQRYHGDVSHNTPLPEGTRMVEWSSATTTEKSQLTQSTLILIDLYSRLTKYALVFLSFEHL